MLGPDLLPIQQQVNYTTRKRIEADHHVNSGHFIRALLSELIFEEQSIVLFKQTAENMAWKHNGVIAAFQREELCVREALDT